MNGGFIEKREDRGNAVRHIYQMTGVSVTRDGYGHQEVGFDGIKIYGMLDGLELYHRSRGKVSRENQTTIRGSHTEASCTFP